MNTNPPPVLSDGGFLKQVSGMTRQNAPLRYVEGLPDATQYPGKEPPERHVLNRRRRAVREVISCLI